MYMYIPFLFPVILRCIVYTCCNCLYICLKYTVPALAAPEDESLPPPFPVAGLWSVGERPAQLSWPTEGSPTGVAWGRMTTAPGETSTHSLA